MLEQRVQAFTRQLGDFVGIEVLNQQGQFGFFAGYSTTTTGGLLASRNPRSFSTTRSSTPPSRPSAIISAWATTSFAC